jgi:hypothetical protein
MEERELYEDGKNGRSRSIGSECKPENRLLGGKEEKKDIQYLLSGG